MSTETTTATAPQAEIIPPGTGPDIETMERADSLAVLSGYQSQIETLKASAELVLNSDPENPANCKLARTARLSLREVRIAVEKKRKELGEGFLRKKQAIDEAAGKLKALIEPYEEKLLAIEQHAERVEAERIETLFKARTAAYLPYFVPGQALPDFRAITDEQFDGLLADAKTLHEARIAAVRKAQEERAAKEKADAEERERIRIENDRLRKEAAEREAAAARERAAAAAAARAAEEKARKEREAIEAKARAEREEIERKAKIEREAAEAKAAEERSAREKLEKEKRDREAKDAKAKADAAKAAKKAATAPDRDKLSHLAASFRAVALPVMTTRGGELIVADIKTRMAAMAAWIEAEAEEI